MSQHAKCGSIFWAVFLCLILAGAASCDRKERYAGIYREVGGEALNPVENYIELKENGQGVWRVSDDEAPFSWRVTNSEIRLYTKSGGVIVAAIKDKDLLEISFPGSKSRRYKKTL
jgi:hypothetical protein